MQNDNSPVGAMNHGVCLRRLARPEVPARVRARRLREHEVVRDVVGAHPLRGPDHQRCPGSLRAHPDGKPTLQLSLHNTQDTPPPVVPFSLVFPYHKLMGGRGWLHAF